MNYTYEVTPLESLTYRVQFREVLDGEILRHLDRIVHVPVEVAESERELTAISLMYDYLRLMDIKK